MTKPEHECHWLPGQFNPKLDENCIDPQQTLEKLLATPDESETDPVLLEQSINLIKFWSENLAYLWDRNKFITTTVIISLNFFRSIL